MDHVHVTWTPTQVKQNPSIYLFSSPFVSHTTTIRRHSHPPLVETSRLAYLNWVKTLLSLSI